MTSALLVVAHPDDETIFAGNLLLEFDWDWSIISLTGRPVTARIEHFNGAICALKAQGAHIRNWVTCDMDDSSSVPAKDDWYDMATGYLAHFGLEWLKPDVVFTHNRRGDYGHPLHCATNYAVHQMFDNVWEFQCPAPSGVGPQWEGLHRFPVRQHPMKATILETCYAEEMVAISRDSPSLALWATVGPAEIFTSDTGRLPS